MVAAVRIAHQLTAWPLAVPTLARPTLTVVAAAPRREEKRRLRCRWEYSATERRLVQRWESIAE
jgi:hypothetical protein